MSIGRHFFDGALASHKTRLATSAITETRIGEQPHLTLHALPPQLESGESAHMTDRRCRIKPDGVARIRTKRSHRPNIAQCCHQLAGCPSAIRDWTVVPDPRIQIVWASCVEAWGAGAAHPAPSKAWRSHHWPSPPGSATRPRSLRPSNHWIPMANRQSDHRHARIAIYSHEVRCGGRRGGDRCDDLAGSWR